MPGHLTDPNPISYNGYTFPNGVETIQFSGELVPDEADRTTQYVRYRIGLQWEVAVDSAASNIDTDMAAIRKLLLQRGGSFVYANRGLGAEFWIGVSGVLDVNGGPKPVAFDFKPKGKNQGCTITWTVEVCIPDQCSAVIAYQGVVMTFNYKVKIRRDRYGYTRRVYSGFFRIPKTAGQIQIADDFLANVIPPGLEGFDRPEFEYEHSFDKTRIDFTVVDEELTHNNLPPGCVTATASHFVRSSEIGFLKWQGVIQGSYSVQKGSHQSVAVSAFFSMAKVRIDQQKQFLDLPPADQQVDPKNAVRNGNLLITGYTFGEPEIYGPNNVFLELTYETVTSLKNIIDLGGADHAGISKCGLWSFVPDRDWATWAQSVETGARALRGSAGLFLRSADDAIVDLCLNTTPVPPRSGNAVFEPGDPTLGGITELQPDPDEEASWLDYEPEIECLEESHAVTSSALPADEWPSPGDGGGGGGGSPGDWPQGKGYTPDSKPAFPTDRVQYRAPSTLVLYFSGRARRAWFPIPRPKVVSYRGLAVKEVSQEQYGCFWRQKAVGNLGPGLPIYYCEWSFRYVVEDRPAEAILPPTTANEGG